MRLQYIIVAQAGRKAPDIVNPVYVRRTAQSTSI